MKWAGIKPIFVFLSHDVSNEKCPWFIIFIIRIWVSPMIAWISQVVLLLFWIDGDFLVDGYNIIYRTNDELKVVKCIYMYASCSGGAVG